MELLTIREYGAIINKGGCVRVTSYICRLDTMEFKTASVTPRISVVQRRSFSYFFDKRRNSLGFVPNIRSCVKSALNRKEIARSSWNY